MSALTAPPIPGFSLNARPVNRSLAFRDEPPVLALTERHRPATLADMVGQGAAVYQLETFLEAPSSRAFLFEGPTGVGKTTAARALANDLGVDADWGLDVIKSAEADGEAVERALRMLRLSCPAGSGWRMVIVDEADLMSPKASHLWLSALEDLPARAVVVFTTNHASKFPDRFLDRCERITFAADGATLAQDGQALVDRIWRSETGRDDAPRLDSIPNAIDADGRISFRRIVAALDPMVRRAKPAPAPALAPVVTSAPIPAPSPVPASAPAPKAPTAVPKPPLALSIVGTIKPAKRPGKPKAAAKPPVPKPPAPTWTAKPSRVDDSAGRRGIENRLTMLEREYERIGERAGEIVREQRELRKRLRGPK